MRLGEKVRRGAFLSNLFTWYGVQRKDDFLKEIVNEDEMTDKERRMNTDWLQREELLIGEENISLLSHATVAVIGLGGVGGYAAEALCRTGIGRLILADKDVFDLSNLNRQLFSVRDNIGKSKVDEAKKRLLSINPELQILVFSQFLDEETLQEIPWAEVDYCIDAIDTMTSKLQLIRTCKEYGVPVVSCMGTGFRMDPTLLKVADIYNTSVCPMAKAMRGLMKKEGIEACQVVYSTEAPIKPYEKGPSFTEEAKHSETERHKKDKLIGSMSFVPGVAGLIMASLAIRHLMER